METGDRTGSHFASEPRAPWAVAQFGRRDPGQAGTAATVPASRAAPSNIIRAHRKEIESLDRAVLLF